MCVCNVFTITKLHPLFDKSYLMAIEPVSIVNHMMELHVWRWLKENQIFRQIVVLIKNRHKLASSLK